MDLLCTLKKSVEIIRCQPVPVHVSGETQYLPCFEGQERLLFPRIGQYLLVSVNDKDPVKFQVPCLQRTKDLQPLDGRPRERSVTRDCVFSEEGEIAELVLECHVIYEGPHKKVQRRYEGLREWIKERMKPRRAVVEDVEQDICALSCEVPDILKGKESPYRFLVNGLQMFPFLLCEPPRNVP